jgi:hypothetical protein
VPQVVNEVQKERPLDESFGHRDDWRQRRKGEGASDAKHEEEAQLVEKSKASTGAWRRPPLVLTRSSKVH